MPNLISSQCRKLLPVLFISFTALGFAAENSAAHEKEEAPSNSDSQSTVTLSVLQAQVLLDRAMVSPGAIDGRMGTNSEHALQAYQRSQDLNATGDLDDATSKSLMKEADIQDYVRSYQVSEDDWTHPFTTPLPDDIQKQAELDALNYTTITELLAERFHCTPELLTSLNPDSDWSTGTMITVPNVVPTWVRVDGTQLSQWVDEYYGNDRRGGGDKNAEERDEEPAADGKSKSDDTSGEGEKQNGKLGDLAGQKTDDGRITSSGLQTKPGGKLTVVVTKEDTSLNVLTEGGNVVFHAPVTAGSEHDPLPLGEWKVNGTERYPKFNYNPELFWDAERDDKKAKIPAGPNNPVGVAWIDISKPHYGLHGTPDAETIGYSESHGCVRLANWDVLRLADMVKPETKVLFLETTEELKSEIKNRLSREDEKSDSEEKN